MSQSRSSRTLIIHPVQNLTVLIHCFLSFNLLLILEKTFPLIPRYSQALLMKDLTDNFQRKMTALL